MTPTVPTPPSPPDVKPEWALDPACLPNLDESVTEDHAPVDRIFVEKQYRLLTDPLYSSWPGPGEGGPFLVLVNVAWFFRTKTPPLAPDCLLSLGVTCPEDLHVKEGHSYFQWEMGKSPEVVIEIVSDRRGGEDGLKMSDYARLGVLIYAIFDPENLLGGGVLRTFMLQGKSYRPVEPAYWPDVGLGLTLWEGSFEAHRDRWLRWCDREGRVIPTGAELARQERQAREEVEQQAAAEREAREEAERKAAERIRELEEALRRPQGNQTP
jgi:hypothetical protein